MHHATGIAPLASPQEAAPLFAGWEEIILLSCLQGVMGQVYADRQTAPRSAAAQLGDFCFLAGAPDPRLAGLDFGRRDLILIPLHEGWSPLIEEAHGPRAVRGLRYAIKKELDCFDRKALTSLVCGLPAQYALRGIDQTLYRQCLEQDWSRDLVSSFSSWEGFERLGLGFVITENGKIVSGASSYARCREGIEIEIDTREDRRRRGLAVAAGAALILECLAQGLYPGWDAQDLRSVALAEKLGYTMSHPYPVYRLAHRSAATI